MKDMKILVQGAVVSTVPFGPVIEGTYSAPVNGVLKNIGDETLTGITLWLVQGTPGGGRVTVAGIPITGTSKATGTAVPDLAPGASHPVVMDMLGATAQAATRIKGESN